MRRRLAVVLVGLVVAACSSTSAPTVTAFPTVRWAGTATAGNGPAGPIDVATVCGSASDTYLLELQHHPPNDLKVSQEWGDVSSGGRQVLVSGTVAGLHQGPGDLPIDHPLGDDLSMDVTLDGAFRAFSQKLGAAPTDVTRGAMHVEISSGYIPHLPGQSSAGLVRTWPDLSAHNLTGFQPGFAHPAIGDPVLVAGRYIVDCGHPDFHTELHPISFLAWAHRTGATTVVRFYANGYRDTEYYNPDPALIGSVSDAGRLTQPDTARFPTYLIAEVLRLTAGATPQLRAFELVGNQAPPTVRWLVCAPGSGGTTHIGYDVRSRPGISVNIGPGAAGCAEVKVDVPSSYSSPDIPARTCVMPWDYASRIAGSALAGNFDARNLIKNFLPSRYWPLVDRDPLVGCADALSGPALVAEPSGRQIRTDATQPFPVYGTLTLSRG